MLVTPKLLRTIMKTPLFLVLLIAVVTFPSLAASDDSWDSDDSWIVFISQHKTLYDEVYSLAKKMKKDTLSMHQMRKLDKLMKRHSMKDRLILERMLNHIRNRYRFNDPIYEGYKGYSVYEGNEMEEVVVIGRMFDQFPMDPAEFSFKDITIMRGIRMTANELYRDGKYEEAYPLLLDLAKRGFKDAQSRLAYILFNGTGDVEKSNLRALGWLGTAAYGESEPLFRVLFNRYMAEVPESVRPTVDAVLAGYREQYDSSAYIDCTTNHRFNQGVVKRTYCQFDLEAQVEACLGFRCSANKVNAQQDDLDQSLDN